MSPERAVRRQRFLFVDVERDATERTVIETGEEFRLILQAAASGVDHDRRAERTAAVELGEQLAIEHMPRIRRQRQQADQDVGASQEGFELRRAVKAFDART